MGNTRLPMSQPYHWTYGLISEGQELKPFFKSKGITSRLGAYGETLRAIRYPYVIVDALKRRYFSKFIR